MKSITSFNLGACVIALLLIAEANGWIKVPQSAIEILGVAFMGGHGLMYAGRAIGAGLAVKGMANVTDIKGDSTDAITAGAPALSAVDVVTADQEGQAAIFKSLVH